MIEKKDSTVKFNMLSNIQKHALSLMQKGKNVFLSGAAGSGKTTLMRIFIDNYPGNCVVVAPTGVAAVNIGGQTIHSFFALPFSLMTPTTLDQLKWPSVREKINRTNCIIIDEISMVRSDVFWAIDRRCKECAKGKLKSMPFGGKQIIVCGDFFQLPPITTDELEENYLAENFNGEFAFCSNLWRETCFEYVMLDTSFRQKNDKRFLSMLKKIRYGEISAGVIDDINNECANKDKKLPTFPIRLCTTNARVKMINNDALMKIDSKPVVFNALVTGIFNPHDYPTEAELVLKVGCRVMVLTNKRNPLGGFFYVNGDCGTVRNIETHSGVSVNITVDFDNGNSCYISNNTWSNMKYVVETDQMTGKRIIRQEEIGSFTQIPLKLAYAITIHKSQGMTLESIDLQLGNGCFAHGQLYTALSRARSLAGLKFGRPLTLNDLILDERVVNFYKDIDLDNNSTDVEFESIQVPIEQVEAMKAYLEKLKNNDV